MHCKKLTLYTFMFCCFFVQKYDADGDAGAKPAITENDPETIAVSNLLSTIVDTSLDVFCDEKTKSQFGLLTKSLKKGSLKQLNKNDIECLKNINIFFLCNFLYQIGVHFNIIKAEKDNFFYETLRNIVSFAIHTNNIDTQILLSILTQLNVIMNETGTNLFPNLTKLNEIMNKNNANLLPNLAKINVIMNDININRQKCKTSFSKLVVMLAAIQKVIISKHKSAIKKSNNTKTINKNEIQRYPETISSCIQNYYNARTQQQKDTQIKLINNLLSSIQAYDNVQTVQENKINEHLDVAYSCIQTIDFKEHSGIKKDNYDFQNEKNILMDLVKLLMISEINSEKAIDTKTLNLILDYKPQKISMEYKQGINALLNETNRKITTSFPKIAKMALDQAFNSMIIMTMKIISLIKELNKPKNTYSIFDIAKNFTNAGIVRTGVITGLSYLSSLCGPGIGNILSMLIYAINETLVQDITNRTSAFTPFLPLFSSIDADIKDTMSYLFEGLFKELQQLNTLDLRFIFNKEIPDGTPLLNCFMIDLSLLLANIYQDESLRLLLPSEIGEIITFNDTPDAFLPIVESLPDGFLPIVESLIDSYLPNYDLETRQKCYEYYTKFIKIYCAIAQLLDAIPLIDDFYTFINNNKGNIYNEQDNDDYAKVLKTVFYYINSKEKFFEGNIKDTSVSTLTTAFNNFTDKEKNKVLASLMERLTSTLSMCICFNENNNGFFVKLGRYLHINREKRGLKEKSVQDNMAKLVNWGTKKLTGSKFKIFTNEMLESICKNKGIYINNINYPQNITPENLNKVQKLFQELLFKKKTSSL